MTAGKTMCEQVVGRPRGRKHVETRRRTRRLAPGVIGLCFVMILASFAFVMVPSPALANPLKVCQQCPNAPSQCEPNCGGGGGGSTPLSVALIASAPSGVSANPACQSDPAGLCVAGYSSSYNAPITASNGELYETTFMSLPAGGAGSYTYYWSYPGVSGWVQGSSIMNYEFSKIGTFSVSVEITESGFSSVQTTITATISAAAEPGGQTYSAGLLGWAISLTQAETQWAVYGMEAEVAVGGIAASILAATVIGAPVSLLMSPFIGVLAGYLLWVQADDHGSGVCFYWVWLVLVPIVSPNPVPSGY